MPQLLQLQQRGSSSCSVQAAAQFPQFAACYLPLRTYLSGAAATAGATGVGNTTTSAPGSVFETAGNGFLTVGENCAGGADESKLLHVDLRYMLTYADVF